MKKGIEAFRRLQTEAKPGRVELDLPTTMSLWTLVASDSENDVMGTRTWDIEFLVSTEDEAAALATGLGNASYSRIAQFRHRNKAWVVRVQRTDTADRVEAGFKAVKAGTPDFMENDDYTNTVDAITNMMLWLRSQRQNPLIAVEKAIEHYTHEAGE